MCYKHFFKKYFTLKFQDFSSSTYARYLTYILIHYKLKKNKLRSIIIFYNRMIFYQSVITVFNKRSQFLYNISVKNSNNLQLFIKTFVAEMYGN